MRTKHTSGPWHVGAMFGEVFATPTRQQNPIPIAAEPEDSHNWTSNARLIAAAPELLEACKTALDSLTAPACSPQHLVIRRLTSAIAKAEGQHED